MEIFCAVLGIATAITCILLPFVAFHALGWPWIVIVIVAVGAAGLAASAMGFGLSMERRRIKIIRRAMGEQARQDALHAR